MADFIDFEAGDVIMKRGQAYKITEVVIREINDKPQHFLNYEPCFEIGRFKGMKCSICVENLDRINIRKPVSVKKAQRILDILTQIPESSEKVNIRLAEGLTNSNATSKVAELAAALRIEQADTDSNFSHSKKELLETVILQLAQELAVVYTITLEDAQGMIYAQLDKLAPIKA